MTEMTSGIGDLLQRLRKDGVEAGETEKQRIVAEAEAKAKAIVAEAEGKAQSIVAAAEAKAEETRQRMDADLAMAARDFTFRFVERVKKQVLEPLIKEKSAEALADPQVLKAALTALISERAQGAQVTVSPETHAKLESYFKGELGQMLSNGGLEIRSEDGLSGFRLQRSGESFTWDVTGEAVAKELAALVEPSLKKYLQITPAKG